MVICFLAAFKTEKINGKLNFCAVGNAHQKLYLKLKKKISIVILCEKINRIEFRMWRGMNMLGTIQPQICFINKDSYRLITGYQKLLVLFKILYNYKKSSLRRSGFFTSQFNKISVIVLIMIALDLILFSIRF